MISPSVSSSVSPSVSPSEEPEAPSSATFAGLTSSAGTPSVATGFVSSSGSDVGPGVGPDVVPQLVKAGLDVTVQSGAGRWALAPDTDYADAGATVTDVVDLTDVDVLLHVRPLSVDTVRQLRPGTITFGLCSPSTELEVV